MLIQDEVKEFLSQFEIGKYLTTKQIKQGVRIKYGRNEGSVIPSDYCYNITNLDRNVGYFKKGYPRLLEQKRIGKYMYLGENYKYTGTITHKGKVVGKWENGEYTFIKELVRDLP